MLPNCIQLSSAAALADTYLYRLYIHTISAAGNIIAAWKLQQSHNNKQNKRNISMNSSCPYIKLFLLPSPVSSSSSFCMYIRWNKRTCLSKRKKSCVAVREEKCFPFFFSGVAWAGLANCVQPRVRSGETSASSGGGSWKASYCVTDFYK